MGVGWGAHITIWAMSRIEVYKNIIVGVEVEGDV